jgi:hypothetical protein
MVELATATRWSSSQEARASAARANTVRLVRSRSRRKAVETLVRGRAQLRTIRQGGRAPSTALPARRVVGRHRLGERRLGRFRGRFVAHMAHPRGQGGPVGRLLAGEFSQLAKRRQALTSRSDDDSPTHLTEAERRLLVALRDEQR